MDVVRGCPMVQLVVPHEGVKVGGGSPTYLGVHDEQEVYEGSPRLPPRAHPLEVAHACHVIQTPVPIGPDDDHGYCGVHGDQAVEEEGQNPSDHEEKHAGHVTQEEEEGGTQHPSAHDYPRV